MRGGCLCGEVTFEVTGGASPVWACHCGQCRKQSGHYWASSTVPLSAITIHGEPSWYQASEKVRRGFCGSCGSFLFWQVIGSDEISFAAGAVESPTGLRLERHIFTADKGDYYAIEDGLPQE
ncbi:GFA family protein [Pseudoroseicyclus sp. H15]